MAFLNQGRRKKQELGMQATPLDSETLSHMSPTENVLAMRQHGYTNSQIIQLLQSQGYDTSQIYNAINQASLSAIPQQAAESMETGMSDYGQGYDQNQQPTFESFQSIREPQEAPAAVSIGEERIQEVAEAIIDEKWQEFAKDIKKVVEWKEKVEDRLSKLEQQMIDLRLSMDSLTKSIMGKISSYDQNITEVGTEVKAMEKVFSKVLPSLTESVNKLDRMTKGYKEPSNT